MRLSMRALVASFVLLVTPVGRAEDRRVAADRTLKTSDGVTLHYQDLGPLEGVPPLVFIPGWRLTCHVWRQQAEWFSRSHRVVVIDPRSQGESQTAAEGNTPERRARDLRELCERAGLAGAVLVGWSQGVQDVAAYVDQFGVGALTGLVLVDSPVSAGPEEIVLHPEFSQTVLRMMGVYAAHPKEYSEGMMASLFHKSPPAAELERLVSDSLRTPTSTGLAMLVADLFAVDRRPALSRFARPTLVIASAESPLLAAQEQMASRLPDARLEKVADAGHAVFLDQPERFQHLLEDFLSGLPKRPSGEEKRK